MFNANVIDWLMAGDPAIAYQTQRDLCQHDVPSLQKRIATHGWGEQLLSAQNPDTSWGKAFYFPKWTNSHYTLLELKHLQLPSNNRQVKRAIKHIIATEKKPDGGIGPGQTIVSDVCVAGMFLNYAAYFETAEAELESIVDFILGLTLNDGGFNCMLNRSGAHHSSVHSTLSVLEGFESFRRAGYLYRLKEITERVQSAQEFLLQHQLYRSDKTGNIIHPSLLTFAYPARWKYNVLRALDYFQWAEVSWDERMRDAIGVVLEKQTKDGRWKTAAHHPGLRHFDMEPSRSPSRWNTLMALRVLNKYSPNYGDGGDKN